uniref:uncharacterized protein LOC122597530 n=1 Tax=Erigeron canadensis TaxID=72917 RepID=UPI001CB946B2|nr:uncharacterized protein LOC122597530 [Erigeron canadensis]
MRITSKSILSPGRAGVRDHRQPNSLSTSLSRRLKKSGSIKGGASPAMFTSKKRGSFENQEPSSPKVTCIGQVRVKSKKKQAKKLRSLSRRHSLGDVGFGKLDHSVHGVGLRSQNVEKSLDLGSNGGQTMYGQSQRESQDNQESCSKSWVHFPVTICDALRAFGSEFSCLFPCRKEGKMVVAEDGHRQGSCGAFARWLVAVQDGGSGGGGERDIELVVGEEEEDEDERFVKKSRRHVFEDLEIVNDRIEGHKDEARVSICVPPKNALLLMRCRSDPVKVEALANRSWEPSFDKNYEEDDGEEIVVFEDCKVIEDLEVGKPQVLVFNQDQDNLQQDEVNQAQELDNVQDDEVCEVQAFDNLQENEVGQVQEYENVQENELGQENVEENEMGQEDMQENEMGQEIVPENETGQSQEHEKLEEDEVRQDEEESLYLELLFEEILEDQDNEIQEQNESTMVANVANIFEAYEEEMAKQSTNGALEKETEKVLPQCLLMMMYEPKLSMEVSRETWVCSKDFKQHSSRKKPPPAPVAAPTTAEGGIGSSGNANATLKDMMKVADGGFSAALQQPARSSCSLPAAPSMAAVLGQKLADAVGYEPFVLTRCKSEPMKTAAAKLLPESCVWENRKVEQLSRVTFGVGSARLGF